MNKLTFGIVKDLFFIKHPNGNIWQDESKTHVTFIPGGFVYDYNTRNNINIVKKLQLTDKNLMYEHEYKVILNKISEIKNILDANIFDDCFVTGEVRELTELEKDRYLNELDRFQLKIKDCYVI